jgi:hypothetical protein
MSIAAAAGFESTAGASPTARRVSHTAGFSFVSQSTNPEVVEAKIDIGAISRPI